MDALGRSRRSVLSFVHAGELQSMESSRLTLSVFLTLLLWPVNAISQTTIDDQLEEVLLQHESQLARLSTLEATWSVTYRNGTDNPDIIERLDTTVAPSFEASTTAASGTNKPKHNWWNGKLFGRTIGFDPEEYSQTPSSIEATTSYLYHEDLPIERLFSWRTLRAYRTFANEADQSLRQLCRQSSQAPKLSNVNGFIRIHLTHPGSEPSSQPSIPRATSILVDVDPTHGYLIRRHTTVLEMENGDGSLTQTIEALEFQEFPVNLFLPTRVNYSAASGNNVAQQEIVFDYKSVNQAVDIDRQMFAENLLVKEFQRYGDPDALGFYVVQADRSLGERFPTEEMASLVRYHRVSGATTVSGRDQSNRILLLAVVMSGIIAIFGILYYKRKLRAAYCLGSVGVLAGIALVFLPSASPQSTLTSQLRTLESAPIVGDAAPSVRAMNLQNGMVEDVALIDHVTVIEFWATWCGPCQPAMKNLNELASEKARQWEGRVQFVTISVDEDQQAAQRYLETHGWLSTRTLIDTPLYESSTENRGITSVVARAYVVSGVPTCLLVDKEGMIAYRGHPMSLDLVSEVERLLAK